MPWCPNCRTEYVEGMAECADCGALLVSEISGKPEPKEANEVVSTGDVIDEVFLCNLSGPVEISYITSMLEEEGILYRMTDSDTGLYLETLMGSSFMGKNIFVGKEDFKRAAEIVASFKSEVITEDEPEEDT